MQEQGIVAKGKKVDIVRIAPQEHGLLINGRSDQKLLRDGRATQKAYCRFCLQEQELVDEMKQSPP